MLLNLRSKFIRMNLGKYINELLTENETVVIPGFGAFTSVVKSSELDEDSDEIKPPSKTITFNSQIRNNDGLLVGKVADEEDISHFDALKQIEKERDKIIYHLENIGRRTLEGTGELVYDENKEILFNPVEDENWLLDSFGLEPVQLNDIPEDSENQNENSEKEDPDPELVKAISGLLVDVESSEPKIHIPEKAESEPFDNIESEPDELQEESVYSLSEEYEKKKKRRWLWLLLLLVPVIAIAIYYFNTKNKTEEFVDPYKEFEESINIKIKEEPVVQEPKPVLKDSVPISKTDSAIQPVTKIEEETQQEVEIKPVDTPKYYLVSGSFKEEENALEYLSQLKADGFNPINLGRNGNFYVIAIGEYKTASEALRAKKEFDSKSSKKGVWILKK